jgi:hypothetical protein
MKKKSKKSPLLFIGALSFATAIYAISSSSIPEKEWLEQRFPEKVDTEDSVWQVLPFGYTLGPWPTRFRNEPMVTKLSYAKGPPQKFLQSFTQLWQPIEAELTFLGPRTLVPEQTQDEWKACYEARWGCRKERNLILDYVQRGKPSSKNVTLTWFDHPEPDGPRGIHLQWDYEKYRIDDFVLFTRKGVAQGFELKTVKGPIGAEALQLFYQTLSSLKVSDDLSGSREWIQNKIKSVNLSEIQKISSPTVRLARWIEVQNWLFSVLSVDPTKVNPFFHLAGVTHLFTLDLIRLQNNHYENQESWILSAKPNLENLYRYSKDFEDSKIPEQIEALLQDVLLQQQRSLTVLKK